MRECGEALVKSFGITPGMKVLDLGCGDGTTALPAGPQTTWIGSNARTILRGRGTLSARKPKFVMHEMCGRTSRLGCD